MIEPPQFVAFALERLRKKGHDCFIVGGAVRDSLLGRGHKDWDLATSAPASEIKKIFSDIPHYQLSHDTVTIVDASQKVEITPFRGKDPYRIEDDLRLRDFTINALAYCPSKGALIDPFGGLEDLHGKLIRAVENPVERFREDPLRLLRAIRLAVELDFRIEAYTARVIQVMSELLKACAPERIREELIRILLVQRPSRGFLLMRNTGLLSHIIPELQEGYLKRQNKYHRYTIFKHIMVTVDTVAAEPLLRLVALFHDIGKPIVRTKEKGRWRFIGHEKESARLARDIMQRLKFASDIREKTAHLVRHHMIQYRSQWSDAAVRRWIRKVGAENVEPLICLRRADLITHDTDMARSDLELLEELERRAKELLARHDFVISARDLAINGNDVMRTLKIPPGPRVGFVLKQLMEMVTRQPELNTKDQLVDILKKRFKV